jgi:hypothetical protein
MSGVDHWPQFRFEKVGLPWFGARGRGVAVSESTGNIVVAESTQKCLLVFRATLEFIRKIDLPGGGAPESIVYASGKFWFTAGYRDFDTRLGLYDEESNSIVLSEFSPDWQEPPLPNLIGHPLMLGHEGGLVLYNPLTGMLYWLDEQWRVNRTLEIPHDAVLGPSVSGNLVMLANPDKALRVSVIGHAGALTSLATINEPPKSPIVGVCVLSKHLIVLGNDFHLYSYSMEDREWAFVEEG